VPEERAIPLRPKRAIRGVLVDRLFAGTYGIVFFNLKGCTRLSGAPGHVGVLGPAPLSTLSGKTCISIWQYLHRCSFRFGPVWWRLQDSRNEPQHFLHRLKVGGLARSHVFNPTGPLSVPHIRLLTQLYDKCSMRREWGLIIWRLSHVLVGAIGESVWIVNHLLTTANL
jgi:hypothetical protein